uniref:Uracil phosphoribosyltransferase homolog n=1 Tax=Cacopsylla melanoneura TaxID=428564 RepID=A0A8D8YE57_9HEMI
MGTPEEMHMGITKSKFQNLTEDIPNLKLLPSNDQVRELQTILRDKNTTRSDFKFFADRLIRLVIEESLNQLPFSKMDIVTPTGATYHGLKYERGNCGLGEHRLIFKNGEDTHGLFNQPNTS